MILPHTPVVELPDIEEVTIPEVSGIGEREAEKLQEIDNGEFIQTIGIAKQ